MKKNTFSNAPNDSRYFLSHKKTVKYEKQKTLLSPPEEKFSTPI